MSFPSKVKFLDETLIYMFKVCISDFAQGHVLYEMAEGQNMEDAIPTRQQRAVADRELSQVLEYIFDSDKPSNPTDAIKEV